MTENVDTDDSDDEPTRVSPSEFMRTRRPEQFSDTFDIEEPILDQGQFEYHLETITARGEEKVFETFGRKLAQQEICPNLIPQTGPTGGGDSKVDTETYPVAGEIADRWYEGEQAAASERWGFAISAKKDWKSKAQSDIVKIAKTGRGYSRIYFISNQFIKDRDRAALEDDLSIKLSTSVRILDRSWIIDAVFNKGNIALAIDALNISSSKLTRGKRVGKLDAERRARLEELEKQIADQDRYKSSAYQLAEDCLDAAILSRELELPRVETDGRFDRAERLATKADSHQQLLRIKYQRAWTNCYWFDDFASVNSAYDDIESLALDSDEAADLERLANTWTTINTGRNFGYLSPEAAQIEARGQRLKTRLAELSSATHRPNNAAHAKTLECTVALTEASVAAGSVKDAAISATLKTFAEIFQNSEHLGGYMTAIPLSLA
jgi:hypothetical protein